MCRIVDPALSPERWRLAPVGDVARVVAHASIREPSLKVRGSGDTVRKDTYASGSHRLNSARAFYDSHLCLPTDRQRVWVSAEPFLRCSYQHL